MQFFRKEGLKDPRWLLPQPGDLTYKRKEQKKFCSSLNWDVIIKNNVVKLIHSRYNIGVHSVYIIVGTIYRTGLEILVGSTVKKKWNKVKNLVLSSDSNQSVLTPGWRKVAGMDKESLTISYFNINIAQSEITC